MNNNDAWQLREILDRATAPPDEPPGVLDAESASLRDGWLRLCRLIEANERSLRVVEDKVEPTRPQPAQQTAWSPWMIAAVAACLLIAVSMTMLVRHFGGIAGQQLADGSKLPEKLASPAKPARVRLPDAADHLQWGDSVDDEITAVSQATLLAQQDWYAQSSRIGAVQSGIDQLENEMAQGKP